MDTRKERGKNDENKGERREKIELSPQKKNGNPAWVFIMGCTGEQVEISASNTKFNLYQESIRTYQNNIQTIQDRNSDFYDPNSYTYLQEKLEAARQACEKLVSLIRTDHSSYGLFYPPFSSSLFLKIKLIDGVSNYPPDVLTGNSEKIEIKKCIKELVKTFKTSPDLFPHRIVLNGHSRGGSACIELAREIYLTFGDTPKIAIHISDPVPGPGRHTKSKMSIPPNVDSLVIIYAGDEKNFIFSPQDLDEIFYDETKTTVATFVLPMKHRAPDLKEINKINDRLWNALEDTENTSKNAMMFSNTITFSKGVNQPIKGRRKKNNFIIATDPTINTNFNGNKSLVDFHDELRESANIQLSPPKNRVETASETALSSDGKTNLSSQTERKKILKNIRSEAKQLKKINLSKTDGSQTPSLGASGSPTFYKTRLSTESDTSPDETVKQKAASQNIDGTKPLFSKKPASAESSKKDKKKNEKDESNKDHKTRKL